MLVGARRGHVRRGGRSPGAPGGGAIELLDLVSGGTFTRATVGWYQTSASALAEAAINARRFANFGGAEGAKLLIERQHTNSVVQSRDITGWTAGSSVTTTGNAEAGPDGAVLADRSQVSSGGFSRYRVSLPGSIGCASWWVKRMTGAGSGAWQGLIGNTGALTGQVATVGETWERRVIVNTFVTASNILVPADGRTVAVTAGDALTAQALDLLTDFHQWDAGVRYPRSPVVTAGSTATCNPDNLSWASGAWDTRLATDTWTIDVWPLFASTEIVSGDVRWLMSFGSGNDGLRIRHDGTGVRVECVDGGSVVTSGPYLVFDRDERLRITIEPSVSRVTVDGVSGGAGAALTWPTAVTLRLGGIAGAAVGSGEEADARVDAPFLGEGATDFIATTLFLGDSITVGADSTNSNGFKARVSADAAAAGKAYRNVGPYRTGTLFDVDHSGIAGNTISQMEARIATDVTPYRPRVVVIHAGTNDLGTGVPGMQADLESLLVAVRAALPSAYLVICEIPERVSYVSTVNDYNDNAIPAAVAAAGLASGTYAIVSPGVLLADLDVDGVHPLDVGHDKISAAVWAAISAWLTSIGE